MTQVPQIPTMKNNTNLKMINKENAVAAAGGVSSSATSAFAAAKLTKVNIDNNMMSELTVTKNKKMKPLKQENQ